MPTFDDIWCDFRVQGLPSLDRWFDLPPDSTGVSPETFREICGSREARPVFAEWLLFLHVCRIPLPDGWTACANDRLFGGNTPTLKELLDHNTAMAVFPLKGELCPSVGRIFVQSVTDGPDNRENIPGDKTAWADCRLFCRSARFDGDSWQLAAALAQRALQESDAKAIREIACHWIASGKVVLNQVGMVELGNKLQLATPRRWLIPENMNADKKRKEIHSVGTVDQAWRWICGGPVVSEPIRLLSSKNSSLHCLVGEAVNPILSCILLLFPEQVHLYCSDKTMPEGSNVRDLLAELAPEISVEVEAVPSDHMADLEDLFRKRLDADVQDGKNVFFNSTGGNRLMGFAAMLAAYTQPEVQIVYRDIDAKPFHMQVIQSVGGTYRNGISKFDRCPPPLHDRINWDIFWQQSVPRPKKLLTLKDILR